MVPCSRPGRRLARSAMPAMAAATTPARMTATARLRLRPDMALRLLAREVAVAGVHDDADAAARVVHRHAPLAHARQRAGAGVLDEPGRAANGGHAAAPASAEVAVVVAAPQAPE